jgi:hypothetical protein
MTKDGKPIGMLRDGDNDVSSKRVWGSIAMATGMALKAVFSVVALLQWIPLAELQARVNVAVGAADGILWAGAALLGVTVAERFAPKREDP